MAKNNNDQPRIRLAWFNREFPDVDSGGYKSGRSSDRDTPEAFSRGITRSAGTRPDFLHFWRAWYRTPNFSERDCKPPPSSIARSTGFMPTTLQPKSVIGQQPSNVIGFATMQLMVVKAKKDAMERFSANFNAELTRIDAPEYGRPAWLAKELKDKAAFVVTVTSCQKWLGGLQIPRSSHLSVICRAFGFNQQQLLQGAWEPPPGYGDPMLAEFHRAWGLIRDDDERKHLVDTARILAGLKKTNAQSRREKS